MRCWILCPAGILATILRMKPYIYFTAFLFLLPLSSEAFTPFNQTARILEENAAVFTISYGFTANRVPLYLPIFGSTAPGKNEFGFRVRANDEPGAYDNAVGVAISNGARIEDGMYVVDPGTSAVFTAIMIVQASSTDDTMQYHTHLNYLPFYQEEPKRFIPLNEHQLQSYVTPKVAL